MASFDNLDTPAKLGQFNQYLSDKTYIVGYTPSAKDFEVFSTVKSEPSEKFVNVLRWYKHIASFTEEERAEIASEVVIREEPKSEAAPAEEKKGGDDDEFDLFGDDDDDAAREAEIERIAEEQRKKKAAKPQVIAKSSVVLDVKVWEAETDLEEVQKFVRAIEMEGLTWGAGKYEEVAFGVKKLVMMCTIVDDLVSIDDLIEQIQANEDVIQSVDIAAFNKI